MSGYKTPSGVPSLNLAAAAAVNAEENDGKYSDRTEMDFMEFLKKTTEARTDVCTRCGKPFDAQNNTVTNITTKVDREIVYEASFHARCYPLFQHMAKQINDTTFPVCRGTRKPNDVPTAFFLL